MRPIKGFNIVFFSIGVFLSAISHASQIASVSNEMADDEKVIIISLHGEFDGAPDLAYYNDFRRESLYGSLSKTGQEVGATDWHATAIPPNIGIYEGQPGFFVVDDVTDKISIIYALLGKTYEKIFLAYSVAIPTGKTAPLMSTPEEWQNGSNWKLAWLLQSPSAYSNNEEFDMCAPTLVGVNSSLTGNASKFVHATGGWTYIHAKVATWWAWNTYNHIAVTMNGDAAHPENTTAGFSVMNKEKKFINVPYDPVAKYSGPPPKISQVNFPGWVRPSEEDAFQAIYSNIYIAGGENYLSRVEVTDNENYAASTYRRVAFPISWDKNQIKLQIYKDEIKKQGQMFAHYFDKEGKHVMAVKACVKCPKEAK